MLVVGLTGGIGSGKSTFARFLHERGAWVIDADELGREALAPGRPAWHSVVDQFGEEILAAESLEIDRKRLASIVFTDPAKLAALNAIVHPVIIRGIADELERLTATNEVVVIDAALIVETGLADSMDVVIAIVAGENARADRVVRERGLTFGDVRARMQSQMDPEMIAAKADIVVRNDGTLQDLEREADHVWSALQAGLE